LTEIVPGDQVIITSMVSSATPAENVYILNVNSSGDGTLYRANYPARTWLLAPVYDIDDTIYVHNVSHLVNRIVWDTVAPSAISGIINIGLRGNKSNYTNIEVFNKTTGTLVSSANYSLILVNSSPILQITDQVSAGDTLTVKIAEGNLMYINGEQLIFGECDFVANTISKLRRGVNGTSVQKFTPDREKVYGLIVNNKLTDDWYYSTWNTIPGIYNTIDGDPLQIATSEVADFLKTDR
jgi:hypothetical protein